MQPQIARLHSVQKRAFFIFTREWQEGEEEGKEEKLGRKKEEDGM